MWLIRNSTFYPRCPQTKARSLFIFIGCFNFNFKWFSNKFLFSKTSLNLGVFHLLIHSHKKSNLYFCGQLHFWDISGTDKIPQALPNCLCSSRLQTFAHLPSEQDLHTCSHFPFSIPHFYCSVLYVWSIIYLCIFLITADTWGNVTHFITFMVL